MIPWEIFHVYICSGLGQRGKDQGYTKVWKKTQYNCLISVSMATDSKCLYKKRLNIYERKQTKIALKKWAPLESQKDRWGR